MKKPKSNPEFPFICVINTICLVGAMLGDNKTSVNKGKPIISLCYPKPLLKLSLILIIVLFFTLYFYSCLKSDEKSLLLGKYSNAEYEKWAIMHNNPQSRETYGNS